jgi:hypothetical protein
MSRHLGQYLVIATLTGYSALQVLGRRAGATAAECRAVLPGDEIVAAPSVHTDHAVTIGAPPDAVWPWLTQLGWHLGGYYTPHWVDRLLFPRNWPSLDHLDPSLVRDLRVGDVIPDGAPGTAWYVVAQAEPPHTLVLHSTTHIPPAWRTRFRAVIDWTWAFSLTTMPGRAERTRLHLRVRGRTGPWWLTALYQAAIVPADFVMAMGMLRGIKARAEAAAPPRSSGRTPLSPEAPARTPPQPTGRSADR